MEETEQPSIEEPINPDLPEIMRKLSSKRLTGERRDWPRIIGIWRGQHTMELHRGPISHDACSWLATTLGPAWDIVIAG